MKTNKKNNKYIQPEQLRFCSFQTTPTIKKNQNNFNLDVEK